MSANPHPRDWPVQMKPASAADRLIVALDLDDLGKAERLVEILSRSGITHFKVGLGLFTLYGPSAVEKVHRNGGRVFLDLKFHDIPSTVSRAVQAATQLGVWMMNLHIQGGSAMMRQAIASVKEEARHRKMPTPLLVGVTILTSMAERELADLGVRKTLKDQVLYLGKLARSAGLDGIVASAKEAQVLRWALGKDFLIVTPGIRMGIDPFSAAALREEEPPRKADDQQRTATPLEAIRAGADYLVVGRPILEHPDPVEAARKIVRELEEIVPHG